MDVVATENGKQEITWRMVDGTLRAIAKRRTELDAHEARWLRRALKLEVWRPLGMVSMIDYMDRVLDYAPHTARERLRVAEALGELSQLGGSLARGALPYSAVRELSRIVIPTTQSEWIAAAKGKSQREIEKLVSGRKKGSRPSDPADPDLRTRPVRFELSPTLYAKYRQARRALDEEHGRHLDDQELFGALLDAVLDGTAAGPDEAGRARNQIAITICEICRQGWQRGGGRQIAVDAATVERAECDAVHIGSIHAMIPARAYQDVSPAVRRLVMERDGGCCRVPGCRSSRGIECHHLKPRAQGGAHDPSNIVLLCGACHHALHEGRLVLSGTADDLIVERPNAPTTIDEYDLGLPELDLAWDTSLEIEASPVEDPIQHVDRSSDPKASTELTSQLPADRCDPETRVDEQVLAASESSHVGPAHVDDSVLASDGHASHVGPHDQSRDLGSDNHSVLAPAGDAAHNDHGGQVDDSALASHVGLPDHRSGNHGASHVGRMANRIPKVRAPDERVGYRSAAGVSVPRPTNARENACETNAPATKLQRAITRSQARDALVGAGWKATVARAAVDAVLTTSSSTSLEEVIVKALRVCMQGRGSS